ncbi:MAG TPA: helix-hairpin-helix domain-containing protein [Bacteroidales bacterium]|nr:helix-hairpin-helix domain-containing protein [Bacteroidales bacterium]
MKHFRRIVAELLGFDRRERRGTFVLAVMLALLLLIRVVAFRPDTEHLNYDLIASSQTGEQPAGQAESTSAPLFFFDPNTASHADLVSLGLTERQAKTLINYRSSGARFRKPQDLLRVYGIDSATSARLIPWIKIAEGQETAEPVRRNTNQAHAEEQPHEAADVRAVVPIDLNRCTASELQGLPGIGPVLSDRIIRYRSLLGGFVDTGQLNEVYGLDSQVVVLISPMLTLTYDSVTPLMLDSCSFSELARHPYVGSSTARLISKYRSLMDTPVTLGDLVGQKVMSHEQAVRLAPYVRPSPDAAGGEYEFILSKVLK